MKMTFETTYLDDAEDNMDFGDFTRSWGGCCNDVYDSMIKDEDEEG